MQHTATPNGTPNQRPDPIFTPPIIESDFAASVVTSTEEPEEPDVSTYPTMPLTPPKRYFQINWWSIVALALVLLLTAEHTLPLLWPLLDNFLHPQATITLFTTQKQLTQTYAYLAVTGTPDEHQNQIPARMLSFTSPTRSVTVTTTGTGYTAATRAAGSATFYNEAPYVQEIAAGTVITTATGIQIVTDQTVTIAAGSGTTNGSSETAAHTIQAGSRANLPAFTINALCCLSGILAQNTSAFTGGADPKPYPMLSLADVQREAASLITPLYETAHQQLQQQIKPVERLLQPVQCREQTNSTPAVGEQATTASVSVSASCTAHVYDYSRLQALTQAAFIADGIKQLGSNFTQRRNPTLTLVKTRLLDNAHQIYELTVTAAGTLVFHLSPAQTRTLKRQLAGQRLAAAQRQLLALAGVIGVYILPARQGDSQLPTDPNQIALIVS